MPNTLWLSFISPLIVRCFKICFLISLSKTFITCEVRLSDLYCFGRSLDLPVCFGDTCAILYTLVMLLSPRICLYREREGEIERDSRGLVKISAVSFPLTNISFSLVW